MNRILNKEVKENTNFNNNKKLDHISFNYPKINYYDIELLELLGEGGFGKVLKGYNKRNSEYIALKFMMISLRSEENSWDQSVALYSIIQEKELLESVSNINSKLIQPSFLKFETMYEESSSDQQPNEKRNAEVQDIQSNERIIILAMEYGISTMTEIMKSRTNSYRSSEICFILTYLIEAFIEAQKIGIAHRDIKTDNFILTKCKDGHYRYKIADFGCGFLNKEEKAPEKIDYSTITGLTKLYVAPEIVNTLKTNDKKNLKSIFYDPWKADVFALGVVMMQMMGFSRIAIRSVKQNCENPDENVVISEGFDEKLFQIVCKTMKHNPDERLSFAELLVEIKALKAEEPDEQYAIECLDDKYQKMPILKRLENYDKFCLIYLNKVSNLKVSLDYALKAEKVINDYFAKNPKKIILHEKNQQDFFNLMKNSMSLLNGEVDPQFKDQKRNEWITFINKSQDEMMTNEEYKWLNTLGNIYNSMGNLSKALEYYKSAIKILMELFQDFEKHPDTALVLHHLAILYSELGDIELAFECCQWALKIQMRLSQDNHIYYKALFMETMGTIYQKNEQFNEALQCHEISYSLRIKTFGENHFHTLNSIISLGTIHSSSMDFYKALYYFEYALKISMKLFGENNYKTGQILINIGNTYCLLSNYNKALEYHQRSLKILLTTVGENHIMTSHAFESIGIDYEKLGSLDKALEFASHTLNIRRNLFGENYFLTKKSLINYNNILKKIGE